MKKLLVPLLLILNVVYLYSSDKDKKSKNLKIATKKYTTKKTVSPPVIDGFINEDAWNAVEWSGDFTQREPASGDAPSQATAFKILYNEKNLYIAIRAFDTKPDKIVKRMSRRDGFQGDFVEVNIDSYNDKRTAFSFTLTAAGVKGDEYISNNGDSWDKSWNPIWYTKVSSDDKGWVAEMRIPLSQLRFADKESHVWGLQVTRRFFRNQENSNWQYIPWDAAGWVHLFGELHGLEGIKPQKQLELQPYIVNKLHKYASEDRNPFRTGQDFKTIVGLDGKIGITSDITLDFTINPDFGQVETDPSQINLSAFEVFFREQRPFFIEGNNTLNFGLSRNDNLFYSRRIGSRPKGYPDLGDDEYADVPNSTKITAAVKLTGKNKNGFSWGVLGAITPDIKARIDNNGKTRQEVIEPQSNYFVGRFQQDLNKGNTIFGGIITFMNRNIKVESLNFLHDKAYSAGIDFRHNWKNRKYYVSYKGLYSNVKGSEEALLSTQISSRRYFQRPNASHVEIDSTRTSLVGTGSTFTIGKQSGKIRFQFSTSYNSPSLELNDIGYLRSTDRITQSTWIQYRTLKPTKKFRFVRVNLDQFSSWDFGGLKTYSEYNLNGHLQFKNFYRLSSGLNYRTSTANSDLRGGPSIKYPSEFRQWFWFKTDSRKKIEFTINPWYFIGNENYSKGRGLSADIRYQPSNALSISVSANINKRRNNQQYVATRIFTDNTGQEENRYITTTVSRKTYSIALRFTYNINPNLSIQYWGQPFAAIGVYDNFKRITNSIASNYNDRFVQFANDEITYNSEDKEYNIDENSNGITDYTVSDPNFNSKQFRSNMVLRWEYKPGSIFFLVWTQSRDQFNTNITDSFASSMHELFTAYPNNIFLIKFTYRFVK